MVSSRTRRRLLALAAVAIAATAALLYIPNAFGHGTVTSPSARQYSCWERWGHDHLNPQMADTDPMCAQAWRANPNAMWNWNGLLREGMAGRHEQLIPDGQLCSGGRAEGGRYNALDAVGPWHTTPLPNNFVLHYEDVADHGGDYYWVYVTRQGHDPTTQPLRWADLERVATTGRIAPREPVDIPVNAPGRTGHHIVYVIWQASHFDQTFYSCSDVWFGGGSPNPTTPSTPGTTPTTPGTTPTTPGTGGLSCSATASVNSWGSGATVTVRVANNGDRTVNNWMLHWAWPSSGVTISNIWNAEHSVMGGQQMASPASWNAAIPAGGSVEFGFNVNGSLSSLSGFDCLPS
jgi:chitin-binding protein